MSNLGPRSTPQECTVTLHHREADALLAVLEAALNKGIEPGVGLRREDAVAAGVKIELARHGVLIAPAADDEPGYGPLSGDVKLS